MRFASIICVGLFLSSPLFAGRTIQTLWHGTQKLTHPVFDNLLASRGLERLKHIDQSGPLAYFGKAPFFSRYEHSVGVLSLLIKANAPIKEQVAGLLHDSSHTAFSHVGDHLFYKSNANKSYQDTVHLDFLKKGQADKITRPFGICLLDLCPDNPTYKALEQELPNLCADRIQYILHTAVLYHKISLDQAALIVDDLHFEKGQWYFTDQKLAKLFATPSLTFTQDLWGSPWNFVFYELFATTLKRALALKIISKEDLTEGTDVDVLEKLRKSKDPKILTSFGHFSKIHYTFSLTDFDQSPLHTKPRFRGVDPLVLSGGTLKRLTDLDPDYKKEFERIRSWCTKGYGITLLIKD